jgi:hypothetical protein
MMPTFPTFSIADGKTDLALKSPGEVGVVANGFSHLLSSLGAPADDAAAEPAGPTPAMISAFALPNAMPKAALQAEAGVEGELSPQENPDETSEGEGGTAPDQPWAAMLGLPGLLTPDGTVAPRPAEAGAGSPAPTGTRTMLLATTTATTIGAVPVAGTDLSVEGKGLDGKAMPAPAAAGAGTATPPDAQPAASGKPELVLPADLLKAALTARQDKADVPLKAGGAPVDGAPKLDVAVSEAVRPVADMTPVFVSAAVKPGEQAAAPATTLAPAIDMAGQMVEHQLDLAHESRWLDQLAKDIARAGSADGHLRFKLNPENLGNLHVEMSNGHAGASVRLIADTEAARALLADAQPRLVAEARAQGVRIAETHVDLGQGGHGHGHSMADQQREQRANQGEAYLTTFKP